MRASCLARPALAGLVVALLVPGTARPWGDQTHPLVNRLAVETLPEGPAAFYRRHVDELARLSNEPDTVLRAREGRRESVRHFLDLDAHMPAPFVGFPERYDQAVARFGKRRLERHGVLPWVILRFRRQLRDALARGNEALAVREAAYLGHYVADAFQPLHLTRNHDGQLSGADGIHRRFENGLVDASLDSYEAPVRAALAPAERLGDARRRLFAALFDTYAAVDRILGADAVARTHGRPGSPGYDRALEREIGPLARRQLAAAASMLGSFWRTAWEEAARRERSTPSHLDRPPDRR